MKRIVILGAGFGGLRTAIRIAKQLKRNKLARRYEIVLVDRHDYQTYTPLLYEVATTSKNTATMTDLHHVATYQISSIIYGLPVRFIKAEIERIDPVRGEVHLAGHETLSADYLVIALGSETNDFDIPGLKDHGLPLKSLTDALRIRDAIWDDANDERRGVRIVVGGGGASGVEFAGELMAWSGELEDELKGRAFEVTIIQGAPTILPGLDPRVIRRASDRLAMLGVHTMTHRKIANVSKNRVTLDDDTEVPFDVLVWTGGVKASSLVAGLPLAMTEREQLVVDEHMQCAPKDTKIILHAKTYAVGDTISFTDPKTGERVPGVARAALSQARIAGENMVVDILETEGLRTPGTPRPAYHPFRYPYVTPVGGKYAIAKLGPFVFSGFLGWTSKGLVELNYLFSVMQPLQALITWFRGLKIFIQNDRLG